SEGRATHVAGLRAPERHTLEIELSRPVFTFRYVLAMNFADAVPRELFPRGASPPAAALVGSGPYRIAEWRRGLGYRFTRNPHYAGSDGLVEGVDLMIGGEASSAAMMLERGELDRVNADPPTRLRFQRDPRLRPWMHRVTPMDVGYLFLNTEMKPFNDVRVRRAVSHAVDRARVVGLTAGQCVPADGIVPSAMPWSNPGRPEYPFDPERARALLREAGLPDGFATELWYIQSRAVDQRIAAGLQQDLAALGIRLDLRSVSYPAFESKVRRRGEAACGIWGWLQDYPDPSTFLDTLLNGDRIQGGGGNNQAYYNNPAFNRCVNEAASLMDAAARLRLFREAEDLAMRDAPWVPLYHEQYSVIRSPRLRGDVPHPVWLWRYETMWLAE
ncbi:MAG: ABC transporter substrate-binding protein, partial [Verrucomicrobia bacterium]|nr:ABC transporter substrate-binding protein [Verrucomicrobiota bacterium]